MAARTTSLLLAPLAAILCFAANEQVALNRTTLTPTLPTSGESMFNHYCATCHGKTGKGDGPAAPALRKTPPNLAELSMRNRGKFPEMRVYSAILGDFEKPDFENCSAWGALLQSLSHNNPSELQMRVSALTHYVRTLQATR